jgi:6-phosphogluconolactonase (cycloisomerase 2 family)
VDAVFDSAGKFLIVAQDNNIGVYQVGQNSLTEVGGYPFAAGTNFNRLVFSPSGGCVVAISPKSQQAFVFTLNRSTGTLTTAPGSPYSTTTPNDVAIVEQ